MTDLAAYEAALHAHDWTFEWSDDPRSYRKGRDQLDALRKMQAELDPTFAIWNSIAPPEFRRTTP